MRNLTLFIGGSLLAASAALAQAPTPPVAPPPPQPGQAEPITQPQPPGIAPAPGTEGKKADKWDVNVAHAPDEHVSITELMTAIRTIACLMADWCVVA